MAVAGRAAAEEVTVTGGGDGNGGGGEALAVAAMAEEVAGSAVEAWAVGTMAVAAMVGAALVEDERAAGKAAAADSQGCRPEAQEGVRGKVGRVATEAEETQ